MNLCVLSGNLGRDPEQRETGGGTPVTKFSLAVNDPYKKTVQWWNVSVWGKEGENCARYLRKGRGVIVYGRAGGHVYQGKDNQAHLSLDIDARHVEFLSGGEKEADEEIPF